MGGSCLIRRARPDDVPAIVRIERRVFSSPWPEGAFRSLVGPYCLVAERAGTLVGFVVARLVAEHGEVLDLAVDPRYRRLGIARQLLTSLLPLLADNGCTSVYLEARETNQAAIELYRRTGFTVVGRRRRYYTQPVEDALVFRTDLERCDEAHN